MVAIADVNETAAKKFARNFDVPKIFVNGFDLLADETIDTVDICTPPQLRLDLIKAAIEHGKHVIVEKPLALSLQEALEIYDVVKQSDTKFSVIQNYR